MKHIIITLIISCFVLKAQSQKYDDVFYNLPNRTLDQAYNDLIEYQQQNPQFANTYIQLGIICEQKMILSEPLQDAKSTRFWAKGADSFWNNFKSHFNASDLRSNYEYYENLKIKASGNKIVESDVLNFVEQHQTFCKNYNDTTSMAYEALESSKMHYNNCLISFKDLCDKYKTQNDILLHYDDNLAKQLEQIVSDIDICEKSFGKYKEITKKFHILNYRQIFDYKIIEDFGVDGLTNSDFYNNRFYIWDYRKWVTELKKLLDNEILPLRQNILKADEAYSFGKKNFEETKNAIKSQESPIDKQLISQLCKFDNNSLVQKLFEYLELRRQLIVLAGDNFALRGDTSIANVNCKKRNIFYIISLANASKEALAVLKNSISNESVARFNDFFENRYKGVSGLSQFVVTENDFVDAVIASQLEDLKDFDAQVTIKDLLERYSTKSSNNVEVPLFKVRETQNIKGQYATTNVAYNQYGKPIVVAGKKRGSQAILFVAKISDEGSTEWIKEINKANEIRNLSYSGGLISIVLTQNELPNIAIFDANGTELSNKPINEGKVAFAKYSDITKRGYMAFNVANGNVVVCQIDSLGAKKWETSVWQQGEAIDMCETLEGIIVFANTDNGVEIATIDITGKVKRTKLSQSMRVESVCQVSAQEYCLICRDKNDKPQVLIIDDKSSIFKGTQQQ